MAIPKFKVGDRVQVKNLSPVSYYLKIKAIHIYENEIVYTVTPNPIPVEIKPMEIAEDDLELVGDYTIVVTSSKCGKRDSLYCSHFRTKEKAEEAIVDLMTTQVTELMMRYKDLKDIESIEVSFKLGHIKYSTDDASYLIIYGVKKED